MAIDFLRDRAVKAMPENLAYAQKIKAAKAASESAAVTKAEAPKVADTDVSLTPEAKLYAKATEVAMSSSGVDAEKVALLRQQFLDGTLEFDYDRMADSIIETSLEMFEGQTRPTGQCGSPCAISEKNGCVIADGFFVPKIYPPSLQHLSAISDAFTSHHCSIYQLSLMHLNAITAHLPAMSDAFTQHLCTRRLGIFTATYKS